MSRKQKAKSITTRIRNYVGNSAVTNVGDAIYAGVGALRCFIVRDGAHIEASRLNILASRNSAVNAFCARPGMKRGPYGKRNVCALLWAPGAC
jgi:hypothetical protein